MVLTGAFMLITIPSTIVQSQDTEPGRKVDPDIKWDVRKEYDEHGNLIYCDSAYSWTWENFDFTGPTGGYAFEDLDSLFGDFSHFPEGMFEPHAFSFGPFSEFPDSQDLDFYSDTSFFRIPHGYLPFWGNPDSSWMDSFFPEPHFPDAYIPIEEFFHSDLFPFTPWSFHGPNEFFDRHKELMERFRKDLLIPGDSLHHIHPQKQLLPQHQKKSAIEIKI
jgi:hypothetical protein